jgi:polyhydroxyalkanoate synthase
MENPDTHQTPPLTHIDVAPQRSRGPHPLPVFLAMMTRLCADDPARLRAVLAGLRRYQDAPPASPRADHPEIARIGSVSLRDHGGSGPMVIVVPSLINPAHVLDLAPGNSLLAGLAARGLRPLSVDWGETAPLGIEVLVAERLVPLIAGLGEPVALAGYCLGGTLALAAATLLGDRVTRVTLLATPWHFAGYGEARPRLADWWARTEPLATQLGVLPIELLQPAFWALDEAGVIAKYARLARAVDTDVAAFAALEDWSNTGAALSLATARTLAETLYRDDAPGSGQWTIAGQRIDPAALGIPILDIIATRDRIVPSGAALSTLGVGTPLPLAAGHVGMVVGGRAPHLLWDPLAQWLVRA